MTNKVKASNEAKEENEFQKLSRQSMTAKEEQIYIRKYKKEASRIKSAVEVLGEIAFARHNFLLSSMTLQATAGEYSSIRQYNTENWTKDKVKEYQKQVKEYHKKIQAIYREQKELSIKILEYHLNLEQKLDFTFEVSQNNVYMSAYISCKAMEFDKGVNSNAN